METGVEPPPAPPRERRVVHRAPDPTALLGAGTDLALPVATLPLSLDDDFVRRAPPPSLLGRVGGWMSQRWRRDR